MGMVPESIVGLPGLTQGDVLRMLGNTIPVNAIGSVCAALMAPYCAWEEKVVLPSFDRGLTFTPSKPPNVTKAPASKVAVEICKRKRPRLSLGSKAACTQAAFTPDSEESDPPVIVHQWAEWPYGCV